jgi:hypothetical protein
VPTRIGATPVTAAPHCHTPSLHLNREDTDVSSHDSAALLDVDLQPREDGLRFTTRFGDGSPIGADVVTLLNEVYEANTVREAWQDGDLLLVDTIRTAHGRQPFEGPREVFVGMVDPVRLTDCSPTVQVTR